MSKSKGSSSTLFLFQGALNIATKYKMNPKEGLLQKEYDEMKEEYQELMKWKETQPVDAVPKIND